MYQPSLLHGSPLELLRLRAQGLCADLLARPPAGSVRAVFLGGSVARGDVWAARIEGGWEIYSDLDVYVVVAHRHALATLREHAAAAGERLPDVVEGARFLRGAEIGVYTLEDLLGQPVRPGTVGLAGEAFWLAGDRAILDALARAQARPMARTEALYLLENRVAELSSPGRPADGPHERLAHVLALKTRLDVGAAHLIADGSYPISALRRMEAIRTRTPATMSAEVRSDLEDAFACYGQLDACVRAGSGSAEVDRAVDLAAVAWRTLAPRVLGGSGADAAALVRRRCLHRRWWSNYREFGRLRHAVRMSRARSAARGLGLAAYSPRAALRMHALVVALARGETGARPGLAGIERYLDRLTRAFGFVDGSIGHRAAQARRAIS